MPTLSVMVPLGSTVDGFFVWNFEFGHWNLFGICFLVLGILMIFIKQVNSVKMVSICRADTANPNRGNDMLQDG